MLDSYAVKTEYAVVLAHRIVRAPVEDDMGNMLDALKKSGLANDKKAKQVEREKKQQQHRGLKDGGGTSTQEIAADLRATEAKQSVETQVQQRLAQVYLDAALGDVNGRKKFYFQTPERFIDAIMLSDLALALLERGKYAIVANASQDDYIVVKRATALAIEAIDKKRVIFFKRQES